MGQSFSKGNSDDLRHLVNLVGLVVWSDNDNGCGIRFSNSEQRQVLEGAGESLAVFHLAQHVRGAGEWLDGIDTSQEAHMDSMDLPLVAFHVATSISDPVRRVLGDIIAQESFLSAWNQTGTDALQVFESWANEVRAVSMRLAAVNRSRLNTYAKPWSP